MGFAKEQRDAGFDQVADGVVSMVNEQPLLLLVDDDDRLRERLRKAFEMRGFEVLTAGTLLDARAILKNETPEFAVIDLRIAQDSGLQIVQELKQIDPETKIVMLTGFGSISTAVEAIRLGATHYLQKPCDADQILKALQGENTDPQENTADLPSLARAEWEYIQRVLDTCEGNISEAARQLHVHRRSLQRKLKKIPPRQ